MTVSVKDCCTCRFWDNIPTGTGGQGHCKRRAPVIVVDQVEDGIGRVWPQPHTTWPVTGEAEGCGEHEVAPR